MYIILYWFLKGKFNSIGGNVVFKKVKWKVVFKILGWRKDKNKNVIVLGIKGL